MSTCVCHGDHYTYGMTADGLVAKGLCLKCRKECPTCQGEGNIARKPSAGRTLPYKCECRARATWNGNHAHWPSEDLLSVPCDVCQPLLALEAMVTALEDEVSIFEANVAELQDDVRDAYARLGEGDV